MRTRPLPLHFYNASKGQKILVVAPSPMKSKLYECVDDDYKFVNGATLEVMWYDEGVDNGKKN